MLLLYVGHPPNASATARIRVARKTLEHGDVGVGGLFPKFFLNPLDNFLSPCLIYPCRWKRHHEDQHTQHRLTRKVRGVVVTLVVGNPVRRAESFLGVGPSNLVRRVLAVSPLGRCLGLVKQIFDNSAALTSQKRGDV
jgi:hypothetical protein